MREVQLSEYYIIGHSEGFNISEYMCCTLFVQYELAPLQLGYKYSVAALPFQSI